MLTIFTGATARWWYDVYHDGCNAGWILFPNAASANEKQNRKRTSRNL